MKNKILHRAAEIVSSSNEATIATIDQDGFPRASTISSIKTEGIHTVWFSTGLSSGKVRCLKHNNKVSVCYRMDGSNVTLIGTAEILTDAAVKKELWIDWFIEHFPKGPEDPDYCILKFVTQKGVLWVNNHYLEFDGEDLKTMEA